MSAKSSRARALAATGGTALLAAGGLLVTRAGLTLDLGVGRRVRPLGPIRLQIAAPPEIVFDVIAAPYLHKTPRAMRAKLEVIERGTDLVLAAHHTPLAPGLTVTTVETVHFERPHRISFRLLKGPVPYVVERYELQPHDEGTAFEYRGELGTDLWMLGAWWGDAVAPSWERTVAKTLDGVRAEAERRAARS
jgi:Polyketide cyclase / dehydrase and lipid transport